MSWTFWVSTLKTTSSADSTSLHQTMCKHLLQTDKVRMGYSPTRLRMDFQSRSFRKMLSCIARDLQCTRATRSACGCFILLILKSTQEDGGGFWRCHCHSRPHRHLRNQAPLGTWTRCSVQPRRQRPPVRRAHGFCGPHQSPDSTQRVILSFT